MECVYVYVYVFTGNGVFGSLKTLPEKNEQGIIRLELIC